jgi:hypothetical protein
MKTPEQTLAAEVIELLVLQRKYFQTKHPDTLIKCKTREKALRDRCFAILHPEQVQPPLFPPEE